MRCATAEIYTSIESTQYIIKLVYEKHFLKYMLSFKMWRKFSEIQYLKNFRKKLLFNNFILRKTLIHFINNIINNNNFIETKNLFYFYIF